MGNAVFESKGQHCHIQGRGCHFLFAVIMKNRFKFMYIEMGGIDDFIGGLSEFGQLLPFGPDTFQQSLILSQGVLSPGLAEPLKEDFLLRLEE